MDILKSMLLIQGVCTNLSLLLFHSEFTVWYDHLLGLFRPPLAFIKLQVTALLLILLIKDWIEAVTYC